MKVGRAIAHTFFANCILSVLMMFGLFTATEVATHWLVMAPMWFLLNCYAAYSIIWYSMHPHTKVPKSYHVNAFAMAVIVSGTMAWAGRTANVPTAMKALVVVWFLWNVVTLFVVVDTRRIARKAANEVR